MKTMTQTRTNSPGQDFSELAAKANDAARLLKLLANERRMLVLCHLASAGEMTVSDLAEKVRLSQSALSQHLALMRQDGLVAADRDGLTMRYRVADPIAERLLFTLKEIYCHPQKERT